MPFRLPLRPSLVVKQSWRPKRLLRPLPNSLVSTEYSTTTRPETSLNLLEKTDHSKTSQQDEFHRTASRHVLRGILRECTYFPDQFAASWIRQHAFMRFRTYEVRNNMHIEDGAYQKRLETVRRESRQGLYQLRRANEGDRKMLLKALSMAYGRIGKRRRELLAPLMPVEKPKENATMPLSSQLHNASHDSLETPPDETQSTIQRTAPTRTDGRQSTKERTDGPVKAHVKEFISDLPAPLRALVQSQIAASPPAIARRIPRRLGVEIPELNTWYKPMPMVRVNNKLSEWYANLLSTVQPALPDQEWRTLCNLATGVTRAKPAIPRRTQITTPPSVLEMTVMRGKLPAELFRKHYSHKITGRFMQRLWAEVFSQCPLMEYETSSDKWKITWGHHVLHHTVHD